MNGVSCLLAFIKIETATPIYVEVLAFSIWNCLSRSWILTYSQTVLMKLALVFATFSFKYTMYLFHALVVFLKNWV